MKISYLIGLVVVGLVLFALMKQKKPESSVRKQSLSKRPAVKVSDYIPNDKNEDGIVCNTDTGTRIIERFVADIGAHKQAEELYKNEYLRLVAESKEKLKSEKVENDKTLNEHVVHWTKHIDKAKDSGNDDDSLRDQVEELEQDISEARKNHKKVDAWLNKNINKLETDNRVVLKAVLRAALAAWKEDSENYHHLQIDYDLPELPDSYHY